ncbi:MAG: DUF5686 family protein, partial [Bacteroidota bacterium]|nr:DUF5686 family protein [Bacteroidota bacterium]
SYIVYEPLFIDRPDTLGKNLLIIRMTPKTYDIDEVRIAPGINPANRIIDLVYENKKLNNPEKIKSFSYTSYNKLHFTFEAPNPKIDTILSPRDSSLIEIDSSFFEINEFIEKQHLFLLESVSNREYSSPGNNREKIIASRVSGFSNPSFTLLATQIQSFSFYNDFITILDKNYLNPISYGSKNKYLFILEDTLFTSIKDSLFIISFLPKKGKNFTGLKGFMYINSNRYALQNVVAEAAESKDMFRIKIQQKYEFINNKQWFPVQLNTDIILVDPADENNKGLIQVESENNKVKVIGVGKTYITNIKLNPVFELKKFKNIALEVEKDAHKKSEDFWNSHRSTQLSEKDTATYHVLDSIGKEEHLDRKLWILETTMNGYIPIHFFNLDIRSIINYNLFEGVRLGVGGISNEHLSKSLFFSGYFAYGFKDKNIKYGSSARWLISNTYDISLQASYFNDVEESGSYTFLWNTRNFDTENFRRFLVSQMDYVEGWSTSFEFNALQYFKTRIFFQNSKTTFGNNYQFNDSENGTENLINKATFSELGIKLRFAYKEKFMVSGRKKISLGTKFPILYANFNQGIDWMNGDFTYSKYEIRISKKILSRSLGHSYIDLEGGIIEGKVPYSKLYNGKGSYHGFSLVSANSFGVMRMNEFLSDHFFSIFFRQDFGKLLFKTKRFQPGVEFVSNFGIGKLQNPELHRGINFKTMEKGYYESGIIINSIINQFFLGYGIGIYYRYGPYQLQKSIDNFSFKLSLKLNL